MPTEKMGGGRSLLSPKKVGDRVEPRGRVGETLGLKEQGRERGREERLK